MHGEYQAFETVLDCPRCLEQIQSRDAVAHMPQPANSQSKDWELNQASVETMIYIAFAHQPLWQSP
jgi:hypothetical protein